ncbi:MAG: hypothetical protein EOO15_09815 [Chitinophagaceae bacterium]|nr:MAG: hypothetical protein EOO15_09815 [Chitinophagaceae bacterium]
MKSCLLVLLLAVSLHAAAQHHEYFTIAPVKKTSAGSYQYFLFQDIRDNRDDLGIVIEKKIFDYLATVLPKPALDSQFRRLFVGIAADTGNDTLLLQLRALRFSERTQQFGGTEAWAFIRVSLYASHSNQWVPLSTLDTVLYATKGDASRLVTRNAAAVITSFVETHKADRPAGAGFTWNEIASIDSLEKAMMPLYTAPKLKDGIYFSYSALRDQKPDIAKAVLHFQGDRLKSVSTQESGRDEVVESFYAVVAEGRFFVAGANGFYEVRRVGNDFVYSGPVKMSAKAEGVVAAQLAFGLAGGLLAGLPVSQFVPLTIDHRNGAPIIPASVLRSGRVKEKY